MRSHPFNLTYPNRLKTTQKQADHERAHRIAESLQRVLLQMSPKETLSGVCAEAFYEAFLTEATVGGDSCDAFALAGGRTALVVADASGKGLAAAERVAEIRFALRAFLREHADPAQALACLNNFVCDTQRLGQRDDSAFATLTLAIVQGASGEMTCYCAGGELPLVLRAGGTIEAIQICGAALGLIPNQEYAPAKVCLELGDIVFLVTDGLTEARQLALGGYTTTRSGAFLGLDGLARFARQAWSSSASLEHISKAILEAVRHYSGGLFHDDVCLLAGRREAR